MGHVRKAVSDAASDNKNRLQELDNLHQNLLALKESSNIEDASEIEGVPAIKEALHDLADNSSPEEVIQAATKLGLTTTGAEATTADGATELNKAANIVDGIMDLSAKITEQELVLDGDDGLQRKADSADFGSERFAERTETITKFKEGCKECGINPDVYSNENEYPDSAILKQLHKDASEGLVEAAKALKFAKQYQQNPAAVIQHSLTVQKEVARLRAESEQRNQVPQAPIDKPKGLLANDDAYVRQLAGLEPASQQAILLGDLFRLKDAGVPLEAIKLLDFKQSTDAMALKGLANKKLQDDEITAITYRLMLNSKDLETMLGKQREIENIEHSQQLIKVLKQNARGMDRMTPENTDQVYTNANKQHEEYLKAAVLFQNVPQLTNEITAAIEHYASNAYLDDKSVKFDGQKQLDKHGLTEDVFVNLLKLATRDGGLFPDLNEKQIAQMLVLDMQNAEISRYDKFGLRAKQQVRAMRAYCLQSRSRFSLYGTKSNVPAFQKPSQCVSG